MSRKLFNTLTLLLILISITYSILDITNDDYTNINIGPTLLILVLAIITNLMSLLL